MKRIGILALFALLVGMTACEEDEVFTFENGVYTAEAADFHYGWKAYMRAEIENDELVAVEFDYDNEAGDQKKSETTDQEYPMDPHPRVWCPQIEDQLLAVDITNFVEIDGVSGATGGSEEANQLFAAILDAAETGDTNVQVLPAEE